MPLKTRQQTDWCFRLWMEWHLHRIRIAECEQDAPPRLSDMTSEELNSWLSKFLIEIHRQDRKPYPGSTLKNILAGIQRYLNTDGSKPFQFFTDSMFSMLRKVLDSRMKELRSDGVGIVVKQAEPITKAEEMRLWDLDILGQFAAATS